jgi:hypothetical protein
MIKKLWKTLKKYIQKCIDSINDLIKNLKGE